MLNNSYCVQNINKKIKSFNTSLNLNYKDKNSKLETKKMIKIKFKTYNRSLKAKK
jgi:hypothetical protein